MPKYYEVRTLSIGYLYALQLVMIPPAVKFLGFRVSLSYRDNEGNFHIVKEDRSFEEPHEAYHLEHYSLNQLVDYLFEVTTATEGTGRVHINDVLNACLDYIVLK